MADVAGSILCRWHEVCRYAPDQASNMEAFVSWFERMKEDYPSRGWWGAPMEMVWPVLLGTNLMQEAPMQLPGKSSPHMTRDEFGVDLYEAIKTASAHQQAVNNVAMYQRHGKANKAELEAQKAAHLFTDLQRLIDRPTIRAADKKEIMRRYPC
jgi:hypothetical protein